MNRFLHAACRKALVFALVFAMAFAPMMSFGGFVKVKAASVTEEHNFTTDGKDSAFFTITGSLSSSKGSVSYNGLSLTQCLKMESATNITFNADSEGTLVLVFGGTTTAAGESVKVDGVSKTVDTNGIVSVDIAAGSHTITKGGTINLFFMSFTYDAADGGETTEATQESVETTEATEATQETTEASQESTEATEATTEASQETTEPAEVTKAVYTFDTTKEMTVFSAGTKTDGETEQVGTNNYFTVYHSAKTKVEKSTKNFDDGYNGTIRLSFAGTVDLNTPKNVIKFETKNAANVKVWWVKGGKGDRQVAIYNDAKEVVTVTEIPEATEANTTFVSELSLAEAGAYYLGCSGGNNYIFKIEVSEVAPSVGDIVGATATLEDKVVMNFEVKLDAAVNAENVTASFTLPSGAKVENATLTAKDNGNYEVSCPVAAKEMADTITITLKSDDNTEEFTYSVKQYADYIVTNENGAYSEKDIDLAKAMLNYGAYAQTYFGYNTESLAAELGDLSSVTAVEGSKGATGAVSGLKYAGTSAILESDVAIRHYFTLEEGAAVADYTFSSTNAEVTTGVAGNRVWVQVSGIEAQNLDAAYNVTITKGEDTYVVDYSVYAYINLAMNQGGTNLQNLAKAMYLYGKAANAYSAN